MRKIFFLFSVFICLGSFHHVYGQFEQWNEKSNQHTGFYLSMSIGPAFGTINNDLISPYKEKFEYDGTGSLFDIKVGGAIKENFILHATLASTALIGPKVTSSNSGSGKASNNLNISESMIGGGVTYYFMPTNVFLSASVGVGSYTITDTKNDDINGSTDNGFAMQLKIGKEWWISKRWGLGAALTYGKTIVNNSYSGYEENLNSNRISILFNATFN